jgi:hypothetical protein
MREAFALTGMTTVYMEHVNAKAMETLIFTKALIIV